MRRALLIAVVCWSSAALAQSAPPLTGRDYNLDLYQGTIIGSTRVVGLGGAYTAIAEGSEGLLFNPAAAVNRTYFSVDDLDWTWHVDFMLGNAFGIGEADFDNNGRAGVGDGGSFLLTAGAVLQYGNFGIGITASWQQLDLGQLGGSSVGYTGSLLDARISAGYALLDHQLILAGGLRIGSLTLALANQGSSDELFSTNVVGVEGGRALAPGGAAVAHRRGCQRAL
jgi:hypothetical protein